MVRAGETVTLIGKKGLVCISAEEIAKKVGTINYEVVDRINPLLPRIIK
jgi:alanine racemase